MPNPKKKKKRARAKKKKTHRAKPKPHRKTKRRAAPKRAAARKRPKKRAKRKNPPRGHVSSAHAFARIAASGARVKGSIKANAAYWALPPAARLAFVRKMRRKGGRSRRAAILLARAEGRAAGAPPRRKNPAMSDAAARAEYKRTHWGLRGKGRVSTGRAADPSHGTLTKMGRLVSVVYETTKRGDGGPTEYEHEFEGRRPTLAYNDGGLVVVGGSYTIKAGGIDG